MTQAESSAVTYHDQIATTWGERFRRPSFSKRRAVFASALSSLPVAGQQWLDAGCGAGNLSQLLVERGAQVVGVDGSAGMVAEARRLCHEFSQATFHEIADLESWNWEGKPLDGILCSSVLEYLKAPERLVANFARWLKPGGKLLVSVPNRNSFLRRMQKISYALTKTFTSTPRPAYLAYSQQDYSTAALRNMLERNGFSLQQTIHFGTPSQFRLPECSLSSPLILAVAQRGVSC